MAHRNTQPNSGNIHRAVLALLASLLVLSITSPSAQGQSFQVLHTFSGGGDGGYPDGGLTLHGSGNFYGSSYGGPPTHSQYGNLFELRQQGSGWLFTTIYSFQGNSDGEYPRSPLVFGPDGALYGATTQGGGDGCGGQGIGCGTVFRATPPPTPCKSSACPWIERPIHGFGNGNDGASPLYVVPAFDSQGNLYGTASYGGSAGGYGVVYKLTPGQGSWTYDVLYSFAGGTDGEAPQSGVILDAAGNLYGAVSNIYFGEVYELTSSGSGWVKDTLYNFHGGDDGSTPAGGLIFDSQGNLYGSTTLQGSGAGTVFQLTPQLNGSWTETFLQDLPGTGSGPYSSLTMDAAQNLYGTTYSGGAYGHGSVFKLTYTDGSWTYATLHDFTGESDGGNPSGGVTLDASGNLYGTTSYGGARSGMNGYGVIWEITP